MLSNIDEEKRSIDEFDTKLSRILADIEKKRSTQLIDILTAVLLSLATVGSAWCAYQSNLWNGIQTFKLMDAHAAGRVSSQKSVEAYQIRSIDGILLMQYINAANDGDQKLADFYFSRFGPVLQKATTDWLKLDPFQNKDAPNSPMKMESYKLAEDTESDIESEQYNKEMDSANQANHTSDTYVMFTVIFAAVLFFGGIASTLQSTFLKNLCLIISGAILILTLVFLINMPVANIFG